MFDADIHTRPLHTPILILNIYNVFEPLVCCLKGIWVQPYTIPPVKLASELEIKVHLWGEKDVITS